MSQSNHETQESMIYSIWPHWEEEQGQPGPLQAHLQGLHKVYVQVEGQGSDYKAGHSKVWSCSRWITLSGLQFLLQGSRVKSWQTSSPTLGSTTFGFFLLSGRNSIPIFWAALFQHSDCQSEGYKCLLSTPSFLPGSQPENKHPKATNFPLNTAPAACAVFIYLAPTSEKLWTPFLVSFQMFQGEISNTCLLLISNLTPLRKRTFLSWLNYVPFSSRLVFPIRMKPVSVYFWQFFCLECVVFQR